MHKRVHVIVYGCITAGLRMESWLSIIIVVLPVSSSSEIDFVIYSVATRLAIVVLRVSSSGEIYPLQS